MPYIRPRNTTTRVWRRDIDVRVASFVDGARGFLAVGCGASPDPHPVVEAPPVPGSPPVDPADQEMYEEADEIDTSVLALVAKAERVDVASIDPSAEASTGAPGRDTLGGYPVIARAAVQLQIVEGKRTTRVIIDAAKRADADALFASIRGEENG